jgi:hypothetical protein
MVNVPHKADRLPVAVAPTPVAPTTAPATFKKRWLNKFFVKRATEK